MDERATAFLDAMFDSVGEPLPDGAIEFRGTDPVLPIKLPVGALGAASIGASALAAARIYESRTGRSQRVTVDLDAASIAMRSFRYVWDTAKAAEPRRWSGGGAGLYPTRDGRWVYLKQMFDYHVQRQAALLGCDTDDDAIRSAVARWDGAELEEAAVAAGTAAGMVRSRLEWSESRQGRAIRDFPVLTIERIGESAPEPWRPGPRPLSGVRVLDLTRVLAGPTGARTLAEHGADVLRVGTTAYPDVPNFMRDTGHGKRSSAIDLDTADGRESLWSLVPGCDVFIQGYRPGAIASRGFSPEAVAEHRPGVVYVSVSAFGHVGPWSERRGFDSVVQIVSGIADSRTENGVPRMLPVSALDYSTGYLATFGAMVALERRAREGGSYHVRVSLAQTGELLCSVPEYDEDAVVLAKDDLAESRIEELSLTSDTPFGKLRHLGPIAQLSETPGRWDRSTPTLDQDPAAWPDTVAY